MGDAKRWSETALSLLLLIVVFITFSDSRMDDNINTSDLAYTYMNFL